MVAYGRRVKDTPSLEGALRLPLVEWRRAVAALRRRLEEERGKGDSMVM